MLGGVGRYVRSYRVALLLFGHQAFVFRAERRWSSPAAEHRDGLTVALWLRVKLAESRRFLIPLFRAVRTKRSQPGITGVTVRTARPTSRRCAPPWSK